MRLFTMDLLAQFELGLSMTLDNGSYSFTLSSPLSVSRGSLFEPVFEEII